MNSDPSQPLVSVIVCTFNRANLITKALESIFVQTYKNLEIIILDDASSDNTTDVIAPLAQKDSRIIYIKNEVNLGITASRNKAIARSHGEFIAMLDRRIAEKRVFPAINITKSGTRREELLATSDELQKMWILRKLLNSMDELAATEFLIDRLKPTKTNEAFFEAMKK